MKNALLSFCLALGATAWAADPAVVTREATGEAAIVAGDVGKATAEATQAALRSAVEQVAGVMIQADTVTRNSVLVRDEVAAHAQGFVKKYDVTAKSQDKGVMKVTVKADVLTGEIDKDLQVVRAIISRLGRTRLLVVIQEGLIDQKGISTRGETLSTALVTAFRGDGWKIIDEKGTGVGTDDKLTLSAGVSAQTLADKVVADRKDVDYLVYGTIALRYVAPDPNPQLPIKEVDPETHKQLLYFVEGDYDLSMLEVRTGRSVAKVAGKLRLNLRDSYKEMAKVSQSYQVTSKVLADGETPHIVATLRNPVLEYLRDEVVNGAEVEVKVSGLPDFGAVDEIQRELTAMHAVKNVKVSGDFEGGSVTYAVRVDGTAIDLGRALDKAKVLKQRRTLKTVAVRNNKVEVAIAK